jgi:hypothetical protein
MKPPPYLLVLSVATVMALPSMAYENLKAKQRFTQALQCTQTLALVNARQARQSLLQAGSLDQSNKSKVGPDLNAEKHLNDAAQVLYTRASENTPNYQCHQMLLTLVACYHLDNCQ